jgi:hypothetical protein
MSLDWNIVMASAIIVIGLTEYIKSWDKGEKLKKLYKLIPLGLSFVVSLVVSFVQGFTVGSFIFSGLLTLAFSVVGYEAILKFVKSVTDKLKIPK